MSQCWHDMIGPSEFCPWGQCWLNIGMPTKACLQWTNVGMSSLDHQSFVHGANVGSTLVCQQRHAYNGPTLACHRWTIRVLSMGPMLVQHWECQQLLKVGILHLKSHFIQSWVHRGWGCLMGQVVMRKPYLIHVSYLRGLQCLPFLFFSSTIIANQEPYFLCIMLHTCQL